MPLEGELVPEALAAERAALAPEPEVHGPLVHRHGALGQESLVAHVAADGAPHDAAAGVVEDLAVLLEVVAVREGLAARVAGVVPPLEVHVALVSANALLQRERAEADVAGELAAAAAADARRCCCCSGCGVVVVVSLFQMLCQRQRRFLCFRC